MPKLHSKIKSDPNYVVVKQTDLVCNPNTIKNFEQGTTESLAIMCIVDFGEPKERTFDLPLHGYLLLNPMSRYSEKPVNIASLPRITSGIDMTANSSTL